MYDQCRAQFVSGPQIANYISGGKGIVTLQSPTGKHHTYEFRRPNDEDVFPKDTLFVYTLVKDFTWMYVGMYSSSYKSFKLTRASRFRSSSPIVKGARYIVKLARNPGSIKEDRMQIYHEGTCSVCGRKLTSPKSIQTGMGPQCRKLVCH